MSTSIRVSGRINSDVNIDLRRFGQALSLGKKDGISVLVSVGAAVVCDLLRSVETDLKYFDKSIEDFHTIKSSWVFKPKVNPILDLIKNQNIQNSLPDNIVDKLLRIQYYQQKGGAKSEN